MTLVLLNAHAGGGRADRLHAPLADWLRRHHPTVALQRAVSAGEARRGIGRLARGSRVVVVGGDGTLHQLLPALLDGGHELALVPAGSGDDSARALGLRGMDWPHALSRGLLADSVPVDIGWVSTEHDSRPFLSSLCAGFDAAVALRAAAGGGRGRLGGMPRYLLATLQELAALQLHGLQVEADGVAVHTGPALFVSTLNSATYGGGMPAVPAARIDDGRLDLLLAGRFGRWAALAMLPRLLLGRHLGHQRVRHVPFRTARIAADVPLPLAADGEAMTAARQITLRVGQGVLRVVPGAAFKAAR